VLKAIFFDAGNTLVFPDPERTLAPLHALGISPSVEQLHAAEWATRLQRDQAAASGTLALGDEQYWRIYYKTLLGELGGQDEAAFAALVQEARRSGNWEFVRPGTREALLQLKQRFRLGVISNSDGRMEALITRVGLRDCFDAVVDSGTAGYEKPDPRIFQAGLRALGAAASESLYVGDVYSIDYLGAKAAGMQAMLFDVCGAYRDSGLPRVESLEELSRWVIESSRH